MPVAAWNVSGGLVFMPPAQTAVDQPQHGEVLQGAESAQLRPVWRNPRGGHAGAGKSMMEETTASKEESLAAWWTGLTCNTPE